ncbi:hypothetical protein DDB_G0272364 [Dictyostelium discoideum AX4]|uniref:EGF-like domain-containing protein n=1 Tax=Dictyostelium discoideum TaxID=44689 RepID=Q55A32_DICDI|nr:hypothetical protein DDB_G0272364 [Dictyostelium discoideum AX4]EAL71334.1 hypothetical protein DDB_G0272364 [Dictyostelium discoideum AX4]|eukprot:XP_645152.1 hypothetical protein DDB_G0272364 [Dictyostelium discoideum AX4]
MVNFFICFLMCSMFFCYINCIEPPVDEYNCFFDFITKINLFSFYPNTNATHYNFCTNNIVCDGVTGTIKDITILNTLTSGYNNQSILPTDLACLPNFNRIYFQNLVISKELVFYQFPQKINEVTYDYGDYPCSPIDQELPGTFAFYFYCKTISGTTIKISHIMKPSIFYFRNSFVHFENDVVATHNISTISFSVFSLSFADFSNFISLGIFQITFNQDFVISSIQNFSTIKSNSISIDHNQNNFYPFYVPINNSTQSLSIAALFEKPNSMIDLSSYGFKHLLLSKVGEKFNLNGEIPIIPPTSSNFLINLGNFNVFPNLTKFSGTFSSSGSNFSIALPSHSGKSTMVSLVNNNFFGTIDESWCNANLIVTGNKLTGKIPTCFTCYFSDISFFNYFSGNQFTNYNQSIGCSEFAPRFELLDISTNTFRVTGINIGFNPRYWLLNSVDFLNSYQAISTGYEYVVSYIFARIPNPKYFNVTFVHPAPSQTIYFPLGDQLPNPTGIKITSNQLIITGELFSSYMGYSNQSVQFEESSTNCTIKDGNFFNITCEFVPSSISTLTYPTIIKIKNDNLIRRVIVNPLIGQLNQIPCPNNCDDLINKICDLSKGICVWKICKNDCGIFGECNDQTGECDCDSNHQGPNCSIPFIQCPTGSNSLICSSVDYNMCNNQTGICTCSTNQQGQNCSLPFKQCPVGLDSLICSGGNSNCNNQTGVCYCDSNHQGSTCSKPFKQCPTGLNSLICSSVDNNMCNNQTGVCTCSPSQQGQDCSLPFKQCPVGLDSLICSGGNNNCKNQTGICYCDSNHQDSDCSLPFKQCPVGLDSLICSGGDNNCNNQTGVCTCSPNHQDSDCSLPFKQCPVGLDSLICSGGNNNCNNQTGICYCDSKFTNDNCSKPNQYISSVSPSTTNGGEASFFGWFGDIHSNPSLLIGAQQCQPITYNSSIEIRCIAPPGNGVYDITFNQNDIMYQLRNGYSYLEIFRNCPNNCTNSNQGNCNTSNGECNCINNYYSFDCSLKRNNNTGGNNGGNPSIDPSTGGTNITDNQVNFQIYFKNLFEIDFNGNIVNQYSLQSNWTLNKTKDSQENNIYKLTQIIQQSCEIVTLIEEISTYKQYSFAGSTFTLDAGSIKLTISISNYIYKSSLNTLQLQLISSVDNENEESDCNIKQVSTNETNTSSFKYIKISKDNRVLQGRFINQILSDGRPTYLSTDIKSDGNSVIATLNLPHFVNQSIIDPDFSVLLETDFKSECDNKNSRKWLIPVAVTVPIVGLCCIGVIIKFKKLIFFIIIIWSLNEISKPT